MEVDKCGMLKQSTLCDGIVAETAIDKKIIGSTMYPVFTNVLKSPGSVFLSVELRLQVGWLLYSALSDADSYRLR